jgi:hypothetical protein
VSYRDVALVAEHVMLDRGVPPDECARRIGSWYGGLAEALLALLLAARS